MTPDPPLCTSEWDTASCELPAFHLLHQGTGTDNLRRSWMPEVSERTEVYQLRKKVEQLEARWLRHAEGAEPRNRERCRGVAEAVREALASEAEDLIANGAVVLSAAEVGNALRTFDVTPCLRKEEE